MENKLVRFYGSLSMFMVNLKKDNTGFDTRVNT